MKLINPLFVAAVLASPFNPADYEPDQVHCESSNASPYIHHIDQLIEGLRNSDMTDTCFLDNLGYTDDECGETIKDYSGKDGGAVFSVCAGSINKKRPRTVSLLSKYSQRQQ